MKVALVYDRVNKIGGAERVLTALAEVYPDAPLFTAVYNKKLSPWAQSFVVHDSFLRKLPFAKSHHELYPYATPFAFERFTFDDYNVVISVTSADAKGIITKPETLHVCYCLTPTRYLWSHYDTYFRNSLLRLFSKPIVRLLQKWDYTAAQRPDHYISISKTVKKRVEKFYDQKSSVLYPPVATDFFVPPKTESKRDYYLVVSRLVAYKRIDMVISAFNTLGLPLVIIGKGHEESKLKRMAKSNVSFVRDLTDRRLREYYQGCRALIFAQEEDFGLAAVEAQSCGAPVIAYKKGGAVEIVREGETGEFFEPHTDGALITTVKRFEKKQYNKESCQKNAARFAKKRFQKAFVSHVNSIWEDFGKLF